MAAPDPNEIIDPNRRRRRRQEIAATVEALRVGRATPTKPAALTALHHNPHGGVIRGRKGR